MAVNKNFVVKNGIEVNTNLLVAAAAESQVGVGTTRPYWKFHVGGGEATRGGIGATDITITGIATIGVGNSSQGALNIVGISTFDGDIDLLGSAGVSTVLWDASENRLEFKDNASVGFGTGNDLTLWHDGTTSYIKDTIGDLRIAGDKITLELENGTDVKVIDQFGVNITGVTTSNRLYISGISTFMDDVDFDSQVKYDESEKALTFVDGAAVRVGTGSDASILHDGTDTIIRSKTGEFKLFSGQTRISNAAGDETSALFNQNSSVDLYFDNTKRLATTAIGATVFGDFITSGVGTFGSANVTGIATFNDKILVGTGITVDANTGNIAVAGILTVGGNLQVTGDITYDEVTGRNLNITGITTFGGLVNVDAGLTANTAIVEDLTDNRVVIAGSSGEIEDDANLTYDGVGLNIGAGSGVTVSNTGNIAAAGIVTANGGVKVGTAVTLHANGNLGITGILTAGRFIGIHTSTDGGGIGIGSTTAHVGYGITYIDFKGPGVSTVYSSSVTGITTIYFQGGGGGSGVGAAGTWQNDGAQGISTAKSVGINTVGVAVTALQGGEKGASSGIGVTFQGLYISNGMVVNDNQLNGNHYIGTAFGGVMAGPVTVNGIITVDGNWAVV